MQRGELLLSTLLVAILLAGVAYESLRGAPKTAELIVTHPASTPFDAVQSATGTHSTSSPLSAQSAPQQSSINHRLLLFLNKATPKDMETLPGIGPVLAQRILNRRDELGRFNQVEELLDISGIGKSRLNALLDGVKQIKPKPQNVPPSIQNAVPIAPRPTYARPTNSRNLPSINRATRGDLMKVSGIGEKTADAILKARTEKNGFRTWDDVLDVSGIGEKKLERIKEVFSL